MKSLNFPLILTLAAFAAPSLMAQTTGALAPAGRVQAPTFHLAPQHTDVQSTVRSAGFPQGPTNLPYPLISTPANDAWARNNAWAAYNANLRQIPTAQIRTD